MEVIQPYIDKGVIKVVADQWVDNWDAANALEDHGERPDGPEEQDRCGRGLE